MVGAYPDPPSHRLPWDRDGSTIVRVTSTVSEYSQTVKERLNNERRESEGNGTGGMSHEGYVCILLAAPMTLEAWWANGTDSDWEGTGQLQVSSDTTNGLDGTWTSVGGDSFSGRQPAIRWRDNWIPLDSVANVVGARFNSKGSFDDRREIVNFHLYGTYESENPALMLWDPDVDQRLDSAHLDWGDVARGTTATKRFRVKNTSADMLAEGVTLSDEALTDGSPTNVGQHDFSDDGGASFADPLDIGDLDPGEISSELLLRRDMANDADLGVWALRVLAQATAWSEVS